MDNEKLAKIAEWLEGGAQHAEITFNIRKSIAKAVPVDYDPDDPAHNTCKTACCIAGAAVQFFSPNPPEPEPLYENGKLECFVDVPWEDVEAEACDLLGLSMEQGDALFVPAPLREHNDPAWAARTIRHLIDTGEVDWEATRAAPSNCNEADAI